MSQLKRKKPEPSSSSGLPEADEKVFNIIKKKESMGIWERDLKRVSDIPDNIVTKCIKNLTTLGLIKVFKHVQFKGKKYYIATEYEPSNEVTGGSWYVDGSLDVEFIKMLKQICLRILRTEEVATADMVLDYIKNRNVLKVGCSMQQVSQILHSMYLDNEIIEVKSTGLGEYHSIPCGEKCYRLAKEHLSADTHMKGKMVSIPCGICPRIALCTPDGVISPSTCVYYTDWLKKIDMEDL